MSLYLPLEFQLKKTTAPRIYLKLPCLVSFFSSWVKSGIKEEMPPKQDTQMMQIISPGKCSIYTVFRYIQ